MKVAVGRAQAEVQRLRDVEQSLVGTVDGLQGDLDDLQAAHQRLQALHEEVERLERIIVKDLKRDMRTHKEKLLQSHRVKRRLEGMQTAAVKLVKIYDDEEGARKEEIAALANKDNPFAAFYDRLKDVRDYHRRFPSMDVTEAENDEALLKEEPTVEFTGEEGLGRYLDLHALFAAFQNAKFGSKTLEYYEFVTGLGAHLGNIPRHFKMGAAYRWLEEETTSSFQAGTLTGWQDQGLGVTPQAGADHPSLDLDLAAFDSVEELEALGAERVKEALSSMGLKCGGTPRERALRLWLTRGKPLHELDRKLFAKGVAPPPPANGAAAPASNGTAKSAAAAQAKQKAAALTAAVIEAKVVRMCELLSNVIADTKGRVEKRQGQTYEEMMVGLAPAVNRVDTPSLLTAGALQAAVARAEFLGDQITDAATVLVAVLVQRKQRAEQEDAVEEAAAGPDEGSDAEDEFVYNPLKLPLGWDGKPIPYWLYKLHGLNQEFKCEVCGNFSYWGRRAYEKHFKEFRHQNGMRALGIPNNKNFFEVTKIADAQKLWEDIQLKQKGGFKAETEEEYEDAAGNVYNKRTYLDLKKQGII
ncbi:hypothetical protein QJQ45_006307 [Haematococcus lacustris]|nr:hypothetical protein QJQ45_006307 [Haematococcus lacustris]